jgi:bifunctional ADP-heptose synthase (sugar kinase/adenylyltransferase)
LDNQILVIGDSCIDRYKIGTVDRISPEAPVPIIKIINEYQLPGMSANVQKNIENLGCKVDLITHHEPIYKIRYVDHRSGQQLLRVDHEGDIKPWNLRWPAPLEEYSAVVISDYDKGFVTYEIAEHIRREYKGPIFVDTKKLDLARFNGCFVKINEHENTKKISTTEHLIVTMGSQGVDYQGQRYPTVACDVVDVCGAGDTFLAALVVEYLNTNCIYTALKFANYAASICVQHRGAYAPTLDEIQSSLQKEYNNVMYTQWTDQ